MTAVNTVQQGSFLTLHYRLSGADGAELVNTFNESPATLTLGTGQLAPSLEQLLIGLVDGAHETFELAPGSVFGQRSADMVQRVKRSLLAEIGDPRHEYVVGDVVQFPSPDGRPSITGVLRELGDDWALFDFNHPLAGHALRFEVKLLGVL